MNSDTLALLREAGHVEVTVHPGTAFENGQNECLVCYKKMTNLKYISVYLCSHWTCIECTASLCDKNGMFRCPYRCTIITEHEDGYAPHPCLLSVDSEVQKLWKPKIDNQTLYNKLCEIERRVGKLEEKVTAFDPFDYVSWQDFHRMIETEVEIAISRKRKNDASPKVSVKKEKTI